MQGSALPCTLLTSTYRAVCHRPNVAQATLTRRAAAPSLTRGAVRLNTERKSVTQQRRRGHVLALSRVRPVARLAQSPHVPPVAVSGLTLAGVMLTVLWTCVPAVRSAWASLAVVLATQWTVFVPIAAPFAAALFYRVWTHGDKLTAFQTDTAERFREMKVDAAEREQRMTKDAAEREQRMERNVTQWVKHTTYAVSAHASSARTAAEAATAAAQNAQAAAVVAQAAAAAAQAPSSTT